jgi:hypothetical protein
MRKLVSAVAMLPARTISGHGGGGSASREGAITMTARLILRCHHSPKLPPLGPDEVERIERLAET